MGTMEFGYAIDGWTHNIGDLRLEGPLRPQLLRVEAANQFANFGGPLLVASTRLGVKLCFPFRRQSNDVCCNQSGSPMVFDPYSFCCVEQVWGSTTCAKHMRSVSVPFFWNDLCQPQLSWLHSEQLLMKHGPAGGWLPQSFNLLALKTPSTLPHLGSLSLDAKLLTFRRFYHQHSYKRVKRWFLRVKSQLSKQKGVENM